MNVTQLGNIASVGAATSAAARLETDNVVVVALQHGEFITICGIDVDTTISAIRTIWRHELRPGGHHRWLQSMVATNVPSLVSVGDSQLCLIGGIDLVIVEGKSGEILKRKEVNLAPTAPATIEGEVITVPQGQRLSLYEMDTLQENRVIPTPRGLWAFAPVVGGLTTLQDEQGQNPVLWRINDGRAWDPSGTVHPHAATVSATDSLIVVPSGCGPPSCISLFDIATDSMIWQVKCAEQSKLRNPAPCILSRPTFIQGGMVISATAMPSVAAWRIRSGDEIWQTQLSDIPTAMCVGREFLWLGLRDGRIMSVVIETGTVNGQVQLEMPDTFPIVILPQSDDLEEDRVLTITRLGGLHLVWRKKGDATRMAIQRN